MVWEPRPPREVARRILTELFAGPVVVGGTGQGVSEGGGGVDRTGIGLADFQVEAARRVRDVLAQRGGAVLADSVGLGKTYVALALIRETVGGGGKALVVVPAALRSTWRRLLEAEAGRSGWRILSHAALSRGASVAASEHLRLVVVDEAHRFRNPRTRRYDALARIAASGGGRCRMLFLTATPINNRIEDLYHLLRLFAADDAFADVGVPGLRAAFTAGDDRAPGVRAVVSAVVVRRSRAMVRARFPASVAAGPTEPADASTSAGEELRFPERTPPVAVRYRDPGRARWVRTIGSLELAAWSVGDQPGAGALVRLGLLKRLDSSASAFAVSLAGLAAALATVRDAAKEGRLLRPRDARPGGRDDRDPLQLTLLELMADPAPPNVSLAVLIRSSERDLRRLRAASPSGERRPGSESAPPDPAVDPKLCALVRLLDRSEGKVLVFTEFRDTAEAIWRALLPRGRIARVDGAGAWLGARPAGRAAVIGRFAPSANGLDPPPERERVDVLVATDVLAEGLNLQDARHVVCYDLPWNPVRLLQRIGRVDRLGSPHARVSTYLFLPTEGLEQSLALRARLRGKLGGIAAVLGSEDADQLLRSLGRDARGGGARPDGPVGGTTTGWDPVTERLRTLWHHVHRATSEEGPAISTAESANPSCAVVPAGIHSGPPGRSPAGGAPDAVVLVRLGSRPVLLELSRQGRARPAGAGGADLIEAALSALTSADLAGGGAGGCRQAADPCEGDPIGPDDVLAVIEAFARRQAGRAHPPPLPASDPARRLGRALRRALAAEGSTVHPRLLRRADALLPRLSGPLHPAALPGARRLLRSLDDPGAPRSARQVIADIERVIGSAGPARTSESPGRARPFQSPEVRLIAVLRRGPGSHLDPSTNPVDAFRGRR